MYQTSHRDSETLLNRQLRVLLCISNSRDRELLADQLRSESLAVVSPADGAAESAPQFDLCVVDTTNYPAIAETIEERRERLGTVHLPVLLVLGPNDSEGSLGPHADSIDDVIAVPTSGAIFRQRVRGLLQRKKQSERLALFARAMDDAQTGISISDAGGDQELRYVNDAFLEMTDYDRAEVLGRNCRFLQGPETEAERVRRIRRAIDEERPVSVLLRNYRKDGEMWWNELEIAPVYGENGVTHFVGFQQDVTERVEQRKALQRFEEIVTAAGDPIYALDGDLQFTLVNDATVSFAGTTEEQLRGRHVSTVFGADHAEVVEAAAVNLTESATHETTVGTVAEDTDGRSRRFQTTVAALPTEGFEGVVCVSRDITEDRQRESRLSVFDRVLRHNLRNKLMVILAQAEQMKWRSEDEAVADAARTIERAGEALLDLAETAREFKQTVDPAEDDAVRAVDVGALLRQTVEETRAEYERVTIAADVPTPLWASAHDSFKLAVTELLERALTDGRDVTITVEATVDRTDGTAAITVRHDGDSLPDGELEALNSGIESELQHTQGLGLWFVRWTATNSGGTFSIENTDAGVCVELMLPLADPPAE